MLLIFYVSILSISKKYHNLFNHIIIIRYLAYLLVEAIIESYIINKWFYAYLRDFGADRGISFIG